MNNENLVTRHATNAELAEVFAPQIKSGRPFVIAISEPMESQKDGKEYQQIYIAQNITRPNRPGQPVSNAGQVEAMFLGWDQKQIVRAIQNATSDQLAAMGLKQGSYLPNGLNLKVMESTTPFYAGQSPKVFPMNSDRSGEVIRSGGEPVYTTAKLDVGTFGPNDHDVLPYDHQNTEATQSTESVEADVFNKVAQV